MSPQRIPIMQPGATAGTFVFPDRVNMRAASIINDASRRWITDTLLQKLNGIETGATKNASDADLRDRTKHTGQIASSDVSDFATAGYSAVKNMLKATSPLGIAYDDDKRTVTFSSSATGGGTPGTGSPEETGFIRADRADLGLIEYDPAAPYGNDLTKVKAALKGTGKYLRVDKKYALASTEPTAGSNYFLDQDMLIFGKGGFVSTGGVALRFMANFSPEIATSNIGTIITGDSNDKRRTTVANVAQADLKKFFAGLAWQFCAKPSGTTNRSGFYPWSLPGTEPNDLTGTTVMAEAMIVAGITFLVTEGSGKKFAENQRVKGSTSGATMRITSVNDDYNGSTKTRVTAETVDGTFSNGEALELAEIWRPSTTGTPVPAGTSLGTISSNGQVYFQTELEADFANLTVPVILRKYGGSVGGYSASTAFPYGDWGSNFLVDVQGLTMETSIDPHAQVASHGASIWIGNAVNYRFDGIRIRGAFRNGFYIASSVNGWITNYLADRLPNNAQQIADGYGYAFGYGVEYIGACAWNVLSNSKLSSSRHGVTQNSSANTQYLTTLKDTLLHGSQKDLIVFNVIVTNNISAAFDTHFGARRTWFVSCKAYGSNRGQGWKDSGGGLFTNRSHTTQYYDCVAVGGWCGFSDVSTGYTTGEVDAAGTDASYFNDLLYDGCHARGYQQMGFRNGLRSEGPNHQIVYRNCSAQDGGLSDSVVYKTVGWYVAGINIIMENCTVGRNNYAGIQLAPGSWDSETSSKPAVVGTTSLLIVGGLTVNFVSNVVDNVTPISVLGDTVAGKIRVAIAGDISVIEKPGNTPQQAVRGERLTGTTPPASLFDLVVGADVKNLSSNNVIPIYRSAGATARISAMAGATSRHYYGAARPSVSYEGLEWMSPSGVLAVFDGTNWMSNGRNIDA